MRVEDMMKAANRYEVVMKVEQGVMTMREAAVVLGVSLRQVRRVRRRAEAGGVKGLVHQRGGAVWNTVSAQERAQILSLRRDPYRQYNLLHFRDVLRLRHGIERSREFYRRLFLLEKLYAPTMRKRKVKHRKRFEAPQAGILIQRDTSIHFWIPGATKPWKLIVDLDDHSRKITGAFFSEHDDVLSNMLVSWETLITHGLPVAYYTDNNPIYNPLNKKPKTGIYQFYRMRAGEKDETVSQWKRAVTELGIECIHSTPYQPQGKGKIERLFRFLQDRLINEMITAKVTTIHEANRYLKQWVEWYNHGHVHSITKQIPNECFLTSNAFRPVPNHVDLEQVFCLKYQREVKADNTISLQGETYQIQKNEYRISYAKAKVEARVYLDKKMKIFYQGQVIGTFPYKAQKTKALSDREDIFALHL